jgi:hypothetical protein
MNYTELFRAIVALFVALLTVVVIPWIKSKTGAARFAEVLKWVEIAVAAAEQMAKAGLINVPKKEFVVQFLNDSGVNVDAAELDAMIEAAVHKLGESAK